MIALQVYSGYKTVKTLLEQVKEVDNHLSNIKNSSMVAVLLKDKQYPVIGKVIKVDDENLTIYYWKETYCIAWKPLMYFNKCRTATPFTDVLSKIVFLLSLVTLY